MTMQEGELVIDGIGLIVFAGSLHVDAIVMTGTLVTLPMQPGDVVEVGSDRTRPT